MRSFSSHTILLALALLAVCSGHRDIMLPGRLDDGRAGHQSVCEAPFACRPARVSLVERNPYNAYGQVRSGEMDFSRQDAIPDEELSEIVWLLRTHRHL